MIFSPSPRRAQRGVALVVVLAFVVLLTGLIVAYFSRSLTGRQLSNNSAGQTRSALLAQSATDTIIAGFKQEIKSGSSTPSPAPSPSPSPANIYYPTANANAVPVRFPTPAPNASPVDPIPNLVRASLRNDVNNAALPSPAVPSLASAVNSTNDAATDGRAVSPARWNSNFLIPGQSTATLADSTPDASLNFATTYAPDWVLVTRNGPAVQTAVGSGSGALNDATANNGNFVIGRYAFAVYDEGGLLDMNVAGHPTPAATAAQTGFTPTQLSRKGSLALADLTQLPVVKNPNAASTGDYLAQSVIDGIVGWRNYASAGLAGASYPNFTFSSAQAANWFTNFAGKNAQGFMTVYGGGTTNTGATDQAFVSRQQLLKLRASLGFGANALQYMGTFSRNLEQPSYVPAHIRYPTDAPSINTVASSQPPAASSVSTYLGNNDAAGTGADGTTAGQDLINPALLTVRVRSAFTRYDLPRTPAVVGEPLLKKKFPLSRLAEISYKATDSTASVVDPTAGHNHIKDWFGLSRTSTASPWTYDHGGIDANGRVAIMTLDKVAESNREPDFAELLKAAINAGSLAKGGPNLHNDQGNYQYTLDVALDYQVLQIMANLIDQSDTDSYPTVIQIAAAGVVRTFRGTEDLPYFYRYHPFSVVTELPDPLLSKGTTVAFTVPDAGRPTRVIQSCEPLPTTGLNKAGKAVALYIPEVWNPHDASSRVAANANRPTRFRLSVITDDPALPAPQTVAWEAGIKSQAYEDWYDGIPPKASIPQTTTALIDPVVNALAPGSTSTALTSLTFSDDGGKLFREPTLLWHADAPANINLAAEAGSVAGPYTDINSGGIYYGVFIGQNAISYTGTVDHATYPASPQATDDKYLFQAVLVPTIYKPIIGSYQNYTFRLQYQDPNNPGNWITYDEKYPDIHGLSAAQLIVNKADYPNSRWANPLPNRTNQFSDSATGYDPRAARFGVGTASEFNDGVMVLEPTAAANYNTDNDAGNLAMTSSKFTVLVTQRPFADMGSKVKYSNPGMSSDDNGGKNLEERWFSGRGWNASAAGAGTWPLEYDGVLFGQNNPAIKMPQRDHASVYDGSNYYEDADGVARRSMGAYAFLATNGILPGIGTTSDLEGLPHATANTYGDNGVGTPTAQSLSRPLMLNRPFQSVGEMSSVFRGTPWKQIDFFTPESGDAALLDVFCVNETPADSVVAGKVNLNTHQWPVLQAIVAGAARDELSNVSVPPPYAVTQTLTNDEASKVAAKLVGITTDTTHAWRGPLTNVADLVGRFVNTTPGSNTGETDFYTFNETVTNKNYTYAGLSAALDTSVYTTASNQTARIQRLRESAIRALSDSGQTRVWNLLIDVVAQTGRYAPGASKLSQFSVDGETRYWVHVAIDRATGEVIDRQIEVVSE